MPRRIFSLALLLSCHALPTTPEERFFDWTELQFAPEVHAERRTRMLELLAADGGGVLVVPSRIRARPIWLRAYEMPVFAKAPARFQSKVRAAAMLPGPAYQRGLVSPALAA